MRFASWTYSWYMYKVSCYNDLNDPRLETAIHEKN